MSAVILEGQPYAVTANSATNAPASRLLLDEPGLTFRSNGNTATIDITGVGGGYIIADTIALVGARLNSNDRIRVQAGMSATNLGFLDFTDSAWTGPTRNDQAICYLPFPFAISAPFFRVTITTARDFVEVSRLLIGERIEFDGIDQKPTITPMSGSTIDDGPGWTSVGPQRTRNQWKASVGNIKNTDFYGKWSGFLDRTGKHTGFLFVPNTESIALQQEAILARHQQDATIIPLTTDRWQVDLQLLEV